MCKTHFGNWKFSVSKAFHVHISFKFQITPTLPLYTYVSIIYDPKISLLACPDSEHSRMLKIYEIHFTNISQRVINGYFMWKMYNCMVCNVITAWFMLLYGTALLTHCLEAVWKYRFHKEKNTRGTGLITFDGYQ